MLKKTVAQEENDITLVSKRLRSKMDELDVIVAAAIYLSSEIVEDNLLSEAAHPKEISPLYNFEGEIVAYHITFTTNCYAVVNNNRSNPTVLEFGKEDNPLINEILNSVINPVIVYNDPFDVFHKAPLMEINPSGIDDIIQIHPELLEDDRDAVAFHSHVRRILEETIPQKNFLKGANDWGFLNLGDLPSATLQKSKSVTSISGDFATTGQFANSETKNHCGAVAVTNLALIFGRRSGNGKLIINNSVKDTFRKIHPTYVSNGPVATIADKAKDYFKSRKFTLNSSLLGLNSTFKTSIDNNKPIGMLLQNSKEAHWIIGIGYRDYVENKKTITYFRILDGWNNNTNRFYKLGSGSTLVSGTSYSL